MNVMKFRVWTFFRVFIRYHFGLFIRWGTCVMNEIHYILILKKQISPQLKRSIIVKQFTLDKHITPINKYNPSEMTLILKLNNSVIHQFLKCILRKLV